MTDNPPQPSRKRRRSPSLSLPSLPPPPPPPPPLTFYAGNLFHLSPVFTKWAKLTAKDVHSLQTRTGFEGVQSELELCFFIFSIFFFYI